MPIYESKTIKQALEDISNQKMIIPAMQRNFVWPESKITDLFDSLMKDYPIGTFLLWDVSPDKFQEYHFSKLVTFFKENPNKFYRGEKATANRTEYIAVLDGQQRLTSINIGVLGSYKMHIKNAHWDKETSYIEKVLALDILHVPQDSEDKYHFCFVPKSGLNQILQIIDVPQKDDQPEVSHKEFWISVKDIYDGSIREMTEIDISDYLEEIDPLVFSKSSRSNAVRMISKLKTALTDKPFINYYSAPNTLSIAQVVDIFVRVNSGGQKLDDADLILSIASGEGSDSFYETLANTVEDIMSLTTESFPCDKKFLLSVSLFFIGAKSLSLRKSENYSRETINRILYNWDNIIESLGNALIFIEKLGFDLSKLSSNNIVVPIAYYFYLTNRSSKYFDQKNDEAKKDRAFIRQWILRVMLTGVFAEGTGSTLISIRSLLDRSVKENGKRYFPLDDFIKEKIKKPLSISDDHASEILEWKYGDRRIVPLLMEISPEVSFDKYTLDHIWPQTYMKSNAKLKAQMPDSSESIRDAFKSKYNYLPNLQLLTLTENSHKNQGLFKEWVEQDYPDKTCSYYTKNLIPIDTSYEFSNFLVFFEKRAELIKKAIRKAFPDSFEDIKNKYNI